MKQAVLALVLVSFLAVDTAALFAQAPASELRLLEKEVAAVSKRVEPAFVFIGGGSGVIISPDGWVLTNYHVAGMQDNWTIHRTGGEALSAELVGVDPLGDVALLKLRDANELPYLELADSDALRVGEYVLAIGNPFLLAGAGYRPTITLGIVSALHRYKRGTGYTDAIQTDCSINPGNSGGPLVNLKGELVGVNGMIDPRFLTRVNTGIGFAIPVNQLKRFLPLLKEGGEVNHGTIPGLRMIQFNPEADGAIVGRLSKRSAAYQAGLRPRDRIFRLGEYDIYNGIRLRQVLGTYPGESQLVAHVRRGEEILELPVVLSPVEVPRGVFPNLPPGEEDRPSEFSTAPRPYLGVLVEGEGPGAKLLEVDTGSPAKKAGLRRGDVVETFNGREVVSGHELIEAVHRAGIGAKVALGVRRGDATREVELTLGSTE